MKTYKRSTRLFILQLIISIPLSFMFIGIPLLVFYVLRYLMDTLIIDDKAVTMKTGILNRHEVRLPYSKINTVTISRDPLGMLMGYGDVVLHTGNDTSGVRFQYVDQFEEIKNEVNTRI